MNPKIQLACTVALTSLIHYSCSDGENKQPNIIFIMSDDHAYQAVSAYGGILKEYAPTPNIDRIAQNGIRFDRCLVTNSISSPSRAVVLTGKYNHLSGRLTNNVTEDFDGSQQTFPKILQSAGYSTAMIGKWHLGTVKNPTGFDFWDILPSGGSYYNPDFKTKDGSYREKGYVTDIITDKAIKWISSVKNGGKPFMVMVHHKAPHTYWQPGPEELSLYKDVTFPEPATLFDDYVGRGTAARTQEMTIAYEMDIETHLKMFRDSNAMIRGDLKRLDPQQMAKWNEVYDPIIKKFYESNLKGKDLIRFRYQRYMQDYLACIAGVDKGVGKILDYLQETGLDKNTIVVYTSDNGFFLGEHGWYDKRFMYEESLRIPLVVQWPAAIKPGSVSKAIVSNLDFAGTFIDAAGAVIPEDIQGLSMLPIFKGKTPENWRKEFYYHYYEYPGVHMAKRHHGVATDRYKLMHFYYDIDEWEMYDLEKDPMEMKNVYNDPAYSEVREDLHKRLNKLMEQFGENEEKALKRVNFPYLEAK